MPGPAAISQQLDGGKEERSRPEGVRGGEWESEASCFLSGIGLQMLLLLSLLLPLYVRE